MAPIVGPPEIDHGRVSSHSTGDPFIDLMSAHFNSPDQATTRPPMGLTENQSPTFLTTGDPCLDFFFHVLPDTPSETIHQLLGSAWDRDPLTALKLVCHLRGVRGTGKSDKESFYTAALWIHHQHPKTLALNIDHIARFGYLKDMPEILFRLHHGNDVRKTAKSERLRHNKRRRHPRRSNNKKKKSSEAKSLGQKSIIQKMLSVPPPPIGNAPEVARELRKKEAEQAKRAMERYNRDPNYQFLHDQISECFAQLLRSDLASLTSGEDWAGGQVVPLPRLLLRPPHPALRVHRAPGFPSGLRP